MTDLPITLPARFEPGYALGFDRGDGLMELVSPAEPLPVRQVEPYVRFASGAVGFVPAATATDFAKVYMSGYGRIVRIDRIIISGTATAAAVLDVLVQQSGTGGEGTSADQVAAYMDQRQSYPNGRFATYSVNRSSGGNGIDTTRQLFAAGKLHLGVAGTPTAPLVFDFRGDNRPMVRDLNRWIVLNLNGQAIPAGCSLDIAVEWSEQVQPPLMLAGDSTLSNATYLIAELGQAGTILSRGNLLNAGSNGYRLEDALLNTNSIPYPIIGLNGILARMNGMPGVLVLCYGLNDMRTGAKTRAELVSMIDAAIHGVLNGTTSGATYTSPLGAGTTFTWPATITACPECQIILWSPNSLTTDGNGSNFVTLTGRFASGYTVAQAAQEITDDLHAAYEAFAADPRVFRVVHKQDVFGRTCTTIAGSGTHAYTSGQAKADLPLMTDILHPNARGQVLSARQLAPHIRDALSVALGFVI